MYGICIICVHSIPPTLLSLFHTACGIANCVDCLPNPNRCLRCIRGTVLYVDEHGEAECFACPLAEFAHEANLQEEELHEEEAEQLERTIIRKFCVCVQWWTLGSEPPSQTEVSGRLKHSLIG